MTVDGRLVKELTKLRRRGGMRDRALWERLGPELRHMCDFDESDGPPAVWLIRNAMMSRIEHLVEDSADRLLLRVALGLHAEACQSSLAGRLNWYAQRQHCSVRTAQRSLDVAIRGLAAAATGGTGAAATVHDPGYVTSDLNVLLRLDQAPAVVVDRRKVAATRDLYSVEYRISVLPLESGEAEGDRPFEVTLGGRLRHWTRERGKRGDHLVLSIELPYRLASGETHEYEVVYRAAGRQEIDPHFAATPLTRCDAATVAVQFGKDRPRELYRVEGVAPWLLGTIESSGVPLALDPSGRIEQTFYRVHRLLAYGLQWS